MAGNFGGSVLEDFTKELVLNWFTKELVDGIRNQCSEGRNDGQNACDFPPFSPAEPDLPYEE